MQAKLFYVHDPMCSWCWGYKPVWKQLTKALEGKLEIQYVVGGLAPDSDVPMPKAMQEQIASYWKKIENYLGAQFNYDFWTNNTPRRSTYPACRALLAARNQGVELQMLAEIQSAYYLEAMNPSDNEVLCQLAQRLDIDTEQFAQDLVSDALNQTLMDELRFARSIGGNSFPSLFLQTEKGTVELPIDYQSSQQTLTLIEQALS
jgi:putative protein-disulfide isomerase